MDWPAFSLSLKLAFWTALLLLPVALAIGRALAFGQFRGKSLMEALVLLPLVLPPTVLGFYLLTILSPKSSLGGVLLAATGTPFVFSFPGILVASTRPPSCALATASATRSTVCVIVRVRCSRTLAGRSR